MDSNQYRGIQISTEAWGKKNRGAAKGSEPKHTQRGGWRRNSGGGVAWRRDGGVCVQGVGWVGLGGVQG